MRAALNAVYRVSGLAAGLFLILIAALSLTQIFARLVGYAAHSFDEFAGYAMAASTFLGLAWTFRCNEHIRVTLALGRAQGGVRRALELLCLVFGVVLIGYFAWFTTSMVALSYELNDMSQGLVPVKLWIPQFGMALGLVILLIALVDDLLTVLRGAPPSYDATAGTAPSFER